MTTQVHDQLAPVRLPTGPVQRRPRSARGSWLLFFVAVVLAAIAIAVVAAALGRTALTRDEAQSALGAAETVAAQAAESADSAAIAEQNAIASLESDRQALLDELENRQNGYDLSITPNDPRFAAFDAAEAQIADVLTPARIAAEQAEIDAQSAVAAAAGDLTRAESDVAAATAPLWITVVASGIVLLGLAVFAIARTSVLRRRYRAY